MNRIGLAIAVASLGLAASANAAITVSLSSGNNATFNNNPLGAMAGSSRAVYNGSVGPITFAAGADTTGVTQGLNPGISAPPAGDTTNYLWGLKAGTTVFFPVDTYSFRIHWGSIDAAAAPANRYDNVLTLSNGDFLTGSDLLGLGLADGLGDQFNTADNKWFLIRSDKPFTSFTVTSPSNAFEFDMTVPEPGTWAMLIAGFGLVGAAARRRRGSAVVTA